MSIDQTHGQLRQRTREIIGRLKEEYPRATTALEHRDPFQLLVATILSAQCTDAMVNSVTPQLFRRYPTPQAMAQADPQEVERIIHPTGFFRQKTRSLISASQMLVSEFGGQVPQTLEELTRLRGVARKTANVVISVCFPRNQAGIAVDTHVKRLAGRLGVSRAKDPIRIEQDLMKIVPQQDWGLITHLLISHGRQVCSARKPRCAECVLNDVCPSAFKV